MIRTQIPRFRLPETVIDEECDYILDIGVEFVGGKRIDSLKALLAEGWDAVFVGSGAPRGRELDIPGRKEAAANIHIGIDWLSSVSFGHISKIGKRVIVLGGGNTAMDCCRSSRRLGGEDVKVIVRSGFEEMKASPWEKEDAMHEDIPILNFLVPKEFTHDNGKLTGVVFEKVKAEYDAKGRRNLVPVRRARPAHPLRRRAGRDRPGELLPLDRARHRHRVRQVGHAQGRSQDLRLDQPEGVLRRRRRLRAQEHHLGGRARPRGRALDRQVLLAAPTSTTGRYRWSRSSARRWASTSGATTTTSRSTSATGCRCATRSWRCATSRRRSSSASTSSSALKETQRCLNCDVQTVFESKLCIECDACVDICPMDCITFTENGEEADLRARLKAPAKNLTQDLYVANDLKTGRVMVKDEDVCLHCGLCAERCPTGAWDMKKYLIDMTHADDLCRTRHQSAA